MTYTDSARSYATDHSRKNQPLSKQEIAVAAQREAKRRETNKQSIEERYAAIAARMSRQ